MSVRPCLLIPIFNHGRTIRAVLDALAPSGLPCFVIDDGSEAATRAVLERAEKDLAFVRVHHRAANGGRGAALKTGYRLAAESGFSHAIQLDADGQHDPADVPRFVEAVNAAPEALVLGTPRFDASAPRHRVWGRQLSRGLVWLATRSRAVDDPLCGFRAIPLAATLPLLERVRTGDHMDFDPELCVRLVWMGVPVVNLPTRVLYPPDGLSHFDLVRDNLRLSGLYVRLEAGMLRRLVARDEPGRAVRPASAAGRETP